MQCAGFVLAGGGSRRMGRDKALLPWEGLTLIESVAAKVRAATGSATLIGDPGRLGDMGYSVLGDQHPDCGPMGGLETLLSLRLAQWNLVAACDMPRLSIEILRLLVVQTCSAPTERGCIVPMIPGGWQPLCAIYHVSCLPIVKQRVASKRLKMRALLDELCPTPVNLDPFFLANVNTPEEWAAVGTAGV